MTKKKYRALMCAAALMTSATFTPAYAAESAEVAENALESSAQGMTVGQMTEGMSGVLDKNDAVESSRVSEKPAARQEDPRTAEWNKTRPEEAALEKSALEFENQTVVDVLLDGAGSAEKTAKAAVTMRAGDNFTTKALASDRQAIYDTGYYYDLYPTFQKVPEGVIVTYHLLENPILKDIEITGNTVLKTEVLRGAFKLKTGEILNSAHLHEDVEKLQEQYRKEGYILAKVYDLNVTSDGVLKIAINEGTLESYKVKGNTKTKDHVILREMRQKVGEPFNAKLARRSMQRVYNLGFFEDVNVKLNPGVEPNAIELEVDVKEKRTGTFSIGAGYSSQDGAVGMISIGDTNFRGTGDAINISYEFSGEETDAKGYNLSYRRPWLDKKETSGTIRIFNRSYEYDDYDTEGTLIESYMRKYSGAELTLSRPVSEYSTNFLTLRNRKDLYRKHETGTDRSNTPWRDKNFGTTRSITFEHVTDTRDNFINPREGGRINLSGEVGGFGGDFNFQKVTIEDARYFPVGHAQVLAVRAQVGAGRGDLSEFALYKVGGQNSLRGYRDDQFRGRKMALGSIEYRFPIVSKVQGAVFTDFGNAWDKDWWPDEVKGSVGVGLSLNTPIGPLRLDYGRGTDGGRVHFSVGGTF